MADIRIRELPTASPAVPTDFVAIDNGSTRKVAISDLVDVGRPLASQAEAEAGTEPTKAMTPLTTAQAIGAQALTPSSVGSVVQAYSANLDTLAAVAPGAAGTSILALAAASDVRNFLDTAPYVSTRTALKAIDTTKETTAILVEGGREGIFNWKTGDFSTQIAADTQEGVYLKADAIAATAGAWVRVGEPTVYHFGASATADSATAISVMDAVMGFVRFPTGATRLSSSLTTYSRLYFDEGAYVTVDATFTFSIRNVVTSSKQWIFRGDGSISLSHDFSIGGENSRYAHASWFGAFPLAGLSVDQAPSIQKAYNAMGNTREGIIELDIGNYSFLTGVTTTRGVHLKGQGTRRTVIRCDADGFDAITSGNVAGKISDLGFEINSSMTTRANAYVRVQHDDFEIYSVNAGQTARGIVVSAGNNCRISNMKAAYGTAQGAGSSLVRIEAGASHSIKGIYVTSSGAVGPDSLVDVVSTASISSIDIEDIQTINPSIPVRVRSPGGNVSLVNIRNVIFGGFAGAVPAAIVHLLSEATFGVSHININGLTSNGYPAAAVRIESTSSGTTENIVIDNVIIPGVTGSGIEFIRSSTGLVRDIIVGSAVEVSERTTPYLYTGNPTGIRISPTALSSALPVASYDFNLDDDTASSINLQRSVFTGWLMISVGTAERAIYTFRAASSPNATAYGTPTANMATVLTSLNGTTGTDGRFTTGVTNGVLYFENRLGSTQRVNVTLMAANA